MNMEGKHKGSSSNHNDRVSLADRLSEAFAAARDDLLSTLYFVLGNKDDAHDAAQEAFLKCWRARAQIPEIRSLRAWIFRIALNVARDQQRSGWYRRSKQFSGEEVLLSQRDSSPDLKAQHRETDERLRLAIMHLRQDEKTVFLLRQNGDLTFEEIAELRHSPLGTVKTQMRSALHKLRQILAPQTQTQEAMH